MPMIANMIKEVLFDNRVEVGVSEIRDGSMRLLGSDDEGAIIKNQEELSELVGLDGNKVARLRTIYDGRNSFTDYYEISSDNLSEYVVSNSEKQIPVSDGLVTREKDLGILLPLADCLGAVVYDPEHEVLGLLHAGRHNIEQEGPKKFIEYFVNHFI